MRKIAILSAALLILGLLPAPTGAEETQKFTLTGVNYTKWLWGTNRYDGSLYNFTTVPGEGFGDNGQGTELEILIAAKPSRKIEVKGRVKARFNQNFWTNGAGFGGGGAGDPGSGDCVGGDCGEFDSRSAQYIKFRGLSIYINPGYSWLDTVLVGSSDWGMFDSYSYGKIRYIDRDNNSGLLFQGATEDRTWSYDLARVSLNRLVYGPNFNTGEYPVQDAAYIGQLGWQPSSVFDGALVYEYVNDIEVDGTDVDLDDGRDVATRFRDSVAGLRFGVHPNPTWDVRGVVYHSSSDSDPRFGAPAEFGLAGFSPVPAGRLDDELYQLDLDINDPFGSGLSFNLEYFDIGSDFVSVTAARREADVLLTEGHDATWSFPGPANAAFGVFGGNPTRIGYSGWQGTAQQVATINVDNEFTDFDEPMAETAIGWKGVTIAPVWTIGALELTGEYSWIDYNTNWQAWGDDTRPVTATVYPNHESDAGIGSYRNAYAPFQDKETQIAVVAGNYFVEVGNGLELFGKVKMIDETDDRMTDPRYLPFAPGDCPGGGAACANVRNDYTPGNSTADLYFNPPVITVGGVTGYQWAPFDDVSDDDRDMDYLMFQLGGSYQLTDELWASLTYENYDVELADGNTAFQAYNLHEMASGQHDKDKLIVQAKYNIGGAEIGFNYEYTTGSFTPDFGDGFVVQFADQGVQDSLGFRVGTPGFRNRFGGWNSLAERDFDQQRLKAFLKLYF